MPRKVRFSLIVGKAMALNLAWRPPIAKCLLAMPSGRGWLFLQI
jgi:hypothetical protein